MSTLHNFLEGEVRRSMSAGPDVLRKDLARVAKSFNRCVEKGRDHGIRLYSQNYANLTSALAELTEKNGRLEGFNYLEICQKQYDMLRAVADRNMKPIHVAKGIAIPGGKEPSAEEMAAYFEEKPSETGGYEPPKPPKFNEKPAQPVKDEVPEGAKKRKFLDSVDLLKRISRRFSSAKSTGDLAYGRRNLAKFRDEYERAKAAAIGMEHAKELEKLSKTLTRMESAVANWR